MSHRAFGYFLLAYTAGAATMFAFGVSGEPLILCWPIALYAAYSIGALVWRLLDLMVTRLAAWVDGY